MDWLLLNPTATYIEAAAAFDVHEGTIGPIMRSDLFQQHLRERRDRMEHAVEKIALNKLQGKVVELATVSIETLTARVEKEKLAAGAGSMGVGDIRETADMALKALGYGAPGRGVVPSAPAINVFVIDREALAAARNKMRSVNSERGDGGETYAQSAAVLAPA